MRRFCFFLSILILLPLITGCTASANPEPREVRAMPGNEVPGAIAETPATDLSAGAESNAQDTPITCPVTRSPEPAFVPPAPYADLGSAGYFWYGAENFWTRLPDDGVLSGLPHNPEGYTEKLFWWSQLFSLKDELQPELIVSGERLDAEAPPLKTSRATNAWADDIGTAMLVGVDFPTPGCWQVTGQYKKGELSFVVWIEP